MVSINAVCTASEHRITHNLGRRSAATPAGSTLSSRPTLNVVPTTATCAGPNPIRMTCQTSATVHMPLPSRVIARPSVSSR
ncbi:Uncharacterised protein [Mycobacteroides abscessus subsp. abscessus]|nr:Uncharacterised protein [Mycobacteroides abscessus subsp. abscessus]